MADASRDLIVVAGGAGGIGRALVARLLDEGRGVVVLDLPASLGRYPPPCEAIALDVGIDASVEAAVAALTSRHGALAGFVNLVGFNKAVHPLAETTVAEFDEMMGGNLRGTFVLLRAVMPLMRDGGSVVLVSSGLAQNVRPGFGVYAAAKAGIIALGKTLAQETAPRLRVNTVAPGAVDTAFLRGGTGRSDEDAEIALDLARYVPTIPLRRLAAPADVVGPIVFLLGPDSAYLTGQTLWINGGAFMP